MRENETQGSAAGSPSTELTPEQIRQVADRVYQLLRREVRIEMERRRPVANGRRHGQGGR